MADEAVVTTTSTDTTTATPPVSVSPFGAWSETPPEPVKQPETPASTDTTTTTTTTEPAKPETPVITEWWKDYGWESLDTAKAEIPKLKEQKPQEIKYENEQSQQVHELLAAGKVNDVIQVYQTQQKIDSVLAAEVTKDTAADVIKLGMKLKYPTLTDSQIDFQYKQDYGVSREPVIKDTEDEADFKERHDAWKEQVSNMEMKVTIAATMAKPEIEKAKTNIVLPKLDTPPAKANEPTADQLAQAKQARDNFLSKLESDYSKTEGFTTKVKDELVEIPVSFKIPDEDKVAIKGRLTAGLDVNELMDKRWFDNKGTPKIEQIISDLYQLENLDKILSGIANKSASERLIEYQKTLKNIDLNTNSNQNTFQPNQNGNAKVSPFSTGAWSEKPVTFN